MTTQQRHAVRQRKTVPLVEKLNEWLKKQCAFLSKQNPVAKAIDYLLNDWDGFTAFLADGRICMTSNAAERALKAIARGRKAWLSTTQHPLSGARYRLPVPVFHRLDHASFPGAHGSS